MLPHMAEGELRLQMELRLLTLILDYNGVPYNLKGPSKREVGGLRQRRICYLKML